MVLPAENLIGEENHGWAVAQSLMTHKRVTGTSSWSAPAAAAASTTTVVIYGRGDGDGAAACSTAPSFPHGPAVADVYIDSVVTRLTGERIIRGLALGTHEGPWGSVGKLLGSEDGHRAAATRLAVLGADGVTWDGEDGGADAAGTAWLTARIATIGGGTSEIQRNIISERLLGLPREPSSDRDVPFEDVLRNARRRG